MKVAKNTVVTLSMSVTDAQNNFIEQTSGEGFTYLHGGYDDFFPKIEEALEGQDEASKPPSNSSRTMPLANTMPNWCALKTAHCSQRKSKPA